MKPDNTTPRTAPQRARAAAGERLQNVLSQRGIASRRHAAEWIAAGAVTVNGHTVYEPGARVQPERDEICVRGERLPKQTERSRTILLYKPRGLICSADSTRGETVCDLMRPHFRERLVPVGRLAKESEGLLRMSNAGELTHCRPPALRPHKNLLARVAGRKEESKIETLRSRLDSTATSSNGAG
jgi:16S rRNA U516 pseudouridylate synthase RsuA-like enzyme